ncbi:WhiB family transcriptional regulator [Streptomyces griseoincarnatus]
MTPAVVAEDWELRARCRGLDPEIFFTKANAQMARAICRACPVEAECLEAVLRREDGLSAGYRHGIFAETTGPERARLAAAEPVRPEPEPGPAEQPTEAPAGPPECGTRSAYQRHKRLGEPIDEACREAYARAAREYRRTGSMAGSAGR